MSGGYNWIASSSYEALIHLYMHPHTGFKILYVGSWWYLLCRVDQVQYIMVTYVDIQEAARTCRLAYPNSHICTHCCYLMYKWGGEKTFAGGRKRFLNYAFPPNTAPCFAEVFFFAERGDACLKASMLDQHCCQFSESESERGKARLKASMLDQHCCRDWSTCNLALTLGLRDHRISATAF